MDELDTSHSSSALISNLVTRLFRPFEQIKRSSLTQKKHTVDLRYKVDYRSTETSCIRSCKSNLPHRRHMGHMSPSIGVELKFHHVGSDSAVNIQSAMTMSK